jgi:hypothetical protein
VGGSPVSEHSPLRGELTEFDSDFLLLPDLITVACLVTGLTILAPPPAPTPPCLGEDKLLFGLDFAFAGEPIPLLPKLPRRCWPPVLPPGELLPDLSGELAGELEADFCGELLGLLILREYFPLVLPSVPRWCLEID